MGKKNKKENEKYKVQASMMFASIVFISCAMLALYEVIIEGISRDTLVFLFMVVLFGVPGCMGLLFPEVTVIGNTIVLTRLFVIKRKIAFSDISYLYCAEFRSKYGQKSHIYRVKDKNNKTLFNIQKEEYRFLNDCARRGIRTERKQKR